MYKSKLQEMCQKRRWRLPEYTFVKDGEDHCPNYKGTVVVKGATFNTLTTCKSSKQALNEAAKVAFLHFDSGPSNQSTECKEKKNCEIARKSTENGEKKHSKIKSMKVVVPTKDVNLKHDVRDEVKKKLRTYAREKNLSNPVYCTRKECHIDLYFRTKVTLGDEYWFQSRNLHKTVVEAEEAAARIALSSLSKDDFNENDPISFKNLLNELTVNEGLSLPKYSTSESDEPRRRAFSSNVEVEGIFFQGELSNSRILAELNAAKAAYTFFMERELMGSTYSSDPELEPN